MPEFNPAQKKQIASWAEERDTLLREISILKTEEESLKKSNLAAGEYFSDIQGRISTLLGRLEELDNVEEKRKVSMSLEIAGLIAQKSRLETEVTGKKSEISGLESRKDLLLEMIKTLTDLHDKVFDRASVMEQIIGHVVKVSQENIDDVHTFMTDLKNSIDEIIQKNAKNVATTNIVLEKLPKYIFEMQKPITFRHQTIPRKREEIK